ncbi:MAG TPA: hypothetical protein VKC65_07365 [Gaiellaceae bacterium]|nr:hypothetical protein [Gaiellaceae bacterium]
MKSPKTPTVIAVTALVVAALAATPIGQAAGRIVLGKNSVGTVQLKKNAVTSAKVRDGSLRAADFGAGQLPAGPQGPKGDTGDRGAQGDPGPSNGYIHPRSNNLVAIDTVQGATVATLNLPAGKYLVFAKTGVASNYSGAVFVQCTLTAANAYDYGDFELHNGAVEKSTTALNVGVTLASAGQAQLWCRGLAQSTWAKDAVLSAIKVGELATS